MNHREVDLIRLGDKINSVLIAERLLARRQDGSIDRLASISASPDGHAIGTTRLVLRDPEADLIEGLGVLRFVGQTR